LKNKKKKLAPAKKIPAKTAAPAAALSPRRQWLFRVFALAVVPLVLLGGLELILRLAGYGYSTGFFEKIHAGTNDFLIANENFSRRFFPPQLMRWPGPVMFAAKKPADTYRIFILGESAARGEPEPNYAASRYLQALLDERFPRTRFEVVNLGITAINSHVIRPIARDCARAGGDLWIIYMGNNEMVGPFGAATVFGAKSPPLNFVRLNLAIQKTRLGQLLADISRRLRGTQANQSWGGMKMFLGNQLRADDPRKETVYRNFAGNLDDIIKTGTGAGAKILLNTVAVNLKDCPPFASLTNANFSAGDAAEFGKLFSAAVLSQQQGDLAGAVKIFLAAEKLDVDFPELQFRLAQCLEQSGDVAAARGHFQKACDVDALPFRADSRINEIIAAAGKKSAGDRLVFFDAANVLAAQAADGVCGREFFFEHVHFNFDGEFALGRAWAAQVEKMLPPEISSHAVTNDWASREICEARLGLTDWNRCAVTEMVLDRLGRPPLDDQLNNAERAAALRAEVARLRARMNSDAAQTAANVYLKAIERSPADYLLRENFAEFLESAGDLKSALAQRQAMLPLLPQHCESFYQVGRLLEELNQFDAAEPYLLKAVALRPRLAEGWSELGNAHLGGGKNAEALADFQRAAELEPANAMNRALAGKALAKLNRHAEAIQNYQQALQVQPDLWEADLALGDEFAALNQFAEAKDAYAQVVKVKPENALAHLDLGVMQARLGLWDEALAQFGETLRLEPGNRQALEYVQRVQDWKSRGR
jgi:tetratricopeptide (TPR) repeat protein